MPHKFGEGQKVSAAQMNENFSSLNNQLKATSSAIGDIKASLLAEPQLQASLGPGWVLADGRNVAGSAYATITGMATIPDLRGTYLRAKDHGRNLNPDGDLALGTYQADAFASHSHTHFDASRAGGGGALPAGTVFAPGPTSPAGGNETRPKSVTVNMFIRID